MATDGTMSVMRRRAGSPRQRWHFAGGATAVTAVVLALLSTSVGAARGERDERPRPHVAADRPLTPASTSVRAEPSPAARWVRAENAQAGTTRWRIDDERRVHEIEGYADAVSAVAGQDVGLYVSTLDATFSVEVYRMGYYQGAGGRLVWTSAPQPGRRQHGTRVTADTHMVEAHWRPSFRVHIDRSWPPGYYLFKLVAQHGGQSYVPLIIRDDRSTAALVVQASVTTWQAYNAWGGYNLYHGPRRSGFARRARAVSFDRPYGYGDGAADLVADELPLVSLVEADGLDVTYWTDIDLHRRPELLLQHRALISLAHDEYWSPAMRRGAEHARSRGVNLAFLGANAVYRRIRLTASPLGPDRREVNYKVAQEDPLVGSFDEKVTSNWRDPPRPHPESALTGQEYGCYPAVKVDLVVADPDSWLLAGTALQAGDRIPRLVGYEYDRYRPGPPAPPDVAVVAHSPAPCHGHASHADTTYYSAPGGAGVFDAGTTGWVPGLADPGSRVPVTRITENLLTAFGAGPAGLVHPSSKRSAADQPTQLPRPAHRS